jgi:hypothetical protein
MRHYIQKLSYTIIVGSQRLTIEKWDGHLPQTMMGSSSVPMVDLSQLNGKGK